METNADTIHIETSRVFLVIRTSAKKALQQVRGHVREGHPVRSYVRRGKETARQLFERHYSAIDRWVWQSIRRIQRLGSHVESADDAYMSAIEASFLALRNYNPARGPLENYLRRAIKFALSRYLAEERSHGLTGVRTLYDRLRAASTAEARDRVLEEFPRIEDIDESQPTPSIEETLEGSRELLRRDEVLGDMERELGVSLQRIREYLNAEEQKKRTWKRRRLADRKLKIFELRALENLSFREIVSRLGIGVKEVYLDFQQISELMREAREKGTFARKAMSIAEQIRQWRLRRLLFGMGRLQTAIKEGFPPEHVRFIRNVLSGILADLTDHNESTAGRDFTQD